MKEKIKLKNGNVLYIIPDEDALNPRTEWDNLGHMVAWHRNYHLGDNSIKGKEARNKFVPEFDDTESLFCALAGMNHPDDLEELQTKEDFKEYFEKVSDAAHEKAVILPLRLLDHSGLSMSIGSGAHWSDPGGWDSGQVGWIYMTYQEARSNFKVDENDTVEEWHGPNKGKRVPLRDVMVRMLEGEVETYDQYLRGDVYGFQLKKIVQFEKKNLETGELTIIEEEEDVDSCWGFYGSDHKENGLYEQAGIKEEDIIEETTV